MLLPHNTTIAVADGRGIKLFRNHGTEAAPRLEAEPTPQFEDVGNDSGGRHHSSTANPDARQLVEDSFAASAMRWLNGEVLGGRIEHLAIIAPPKALGEMRRHYHPELRKRLIGEFPKELTETAPAALKVAIAAAMA